MTRHLLEVLATEVDVFDGQLTEPEVHVNGIVDVWRFTALAAAVVGLLWGEEGPGIGLAEGGVFVLEVLSVASGARGLLTAADDAEKKLRISFMSVEKYKWFGRAIPCVKTIVLAQSTDGAWKPISVDGKAKTQQ